MRQTEVVGPEGRVLLSPTDPRCAPRSPHPEYILWGTLDFNPWRCEMADNEYELPCPCGSTGTVQRGDQWFCNPCDPGPTS